MLIQTDSIMPNSKRRKRRRSFFPDQLSDHFAQQTQIHNSKLTTTNMSRATETAVMLEELLTPSHSGPQQLSRLLNFIGFGGPQRKDPSAVRIGVLGASQVGCCIYLLCVGTT